jgi:hypothetical protein
MTRRQVERIREDLAALRDELETIVMPEGAQTQIVQAAAGALTTVIVALNNQDMREMGH